MSSVDGLLPELRPLSGRLGVVCGASRGVGRGLALGLGEAGATVIVTGRSSEAGAVTDGRAETIEGTARAVSTAGGRGFPFRCDHCDPRQIDLLAQYVRRQAPAPDVLALNVWGGNEGYDGERYGDGSSWGAPFWRRPPAMFGRMLETGVYANLLTAQALVPAMVAAGRGVVAVITADSDGTYLGDAWYDMAKAAMARLALAMAADLAGTGVTALALSPGFVRTERVMDAGLAEAATETPLYAGRALAALAADTGVARWSGRVVHAADLADMYGLTDEDGARPRRFVIEPVA